MSDCAIAKHAPDDHRRGRQDPDHRCPIPGERLERDVQDTDQRQERGDLRRGRHERGHRRGRPLVHVGRPLVERHRRHLEPEPGRQEDERQQRERLVARLTRERVRDRRDAGRAGGAVRPRDTEQEERRRERPQQEVLHRGLVRVPATGDAGQDVERQRQDLERQEDQDQVGRGRDQRHPGGGEQDQRVELPAIRIARTREVVRAEQQPHPGDPEQQQPRDHREAIDRDHPAHHGRRAVPVPERERRQRGRDQAGERQREVPQPLGLRSHRLVEQAEDRHAAEEQLGEDRRELELRRGDHGSAPVRLHDARGADVGDVIGRHVRDHSLRRGIDAVGEELREDAEDQQQRQDRRQDQAPRGGSRRAAASAPRGSGRTPSAGRTRAGRSPPGRPRPRPAHRTTR